MKRLAAAAALFTLGGAALVPLLPRVSYAATLCTNTPSVSSISAGGAQPQSASPGATVTVTGSNFTSALCNRLQVTIGPTTFTVTAQSSTQFQFNAQAGDSGEVSIAALDNQNPPQATPSSNTGLIFVIAPTGNALDNGSPTTGSTVHLNGTNLKFNLPNNLETYSGSWRWTNGSGCPSAPSASSPTLASNAQLNVPMPGQFCQGSVAVTLSAPCNTSLTACAYNPSATRMSFTLSAPFDIAPKVTSQPGSGVAGQNATVGGSGFGTSGTVTVGSVAAQSSWTDGSVSFTIPAGATSSNVQLTRSYDGVSFSGGGLSVTASANQPSPPKAAVGDSVTVTGAGLGSPGSVSVNGVQATVSSWTSTAITFAVPAGATTGPITINPNGTNPPASAPALTVIPKITGITPSHATAGSLIEIDGTTFGTQQGAVSIGGENAQVTLWGDKSVLAQIPSDLSPGSTTVMVSPPGTDSASFPYAIDVPPPPPSSGSGSSSSSSHSSSNQSSSSSSAASTFIAPNPSGPIIAHGSVPFVRPSPPPGPVSLRLNSAANQSDPGSTVKFTVTLIAFGKPVAGAPVDLLLVIEPGSDASILPTHAVTDANGQVQGTIHLSKTPGDHIVLARSGIYSDEIRVVGRGASNAVAASNQLPGSAPSSAPPFLAVRSPVLWALVSCLLLFGVGFGLNLITSPAVVGAPEGGSGEGRSASGSLRGAGAMLGGVLRVPAGLVAVLGATLVGAMRRGRG